MTFGTGFWPDFWIVLTICLVTLRLTSPIWRLWLHRRDRRWLRKNGRPTPAKILKFQDTGFSIGAGDSKGVVGGKMRWVSVELEICSQDEEQPYRVKTLEQLHPNDIVGIVSGMMVKTLAHSKKRNAAVVTDWGER